MYTNIVKVEDTSVYLLNGNKKSDNECANEQNEKSDNECGNEQSGKCVDEKFCNSKYLGFF